YVNRFHTLYCKKIVLGVKVGFVVCLNCLINRLQFLHRFLSIKIKRNDWKAACLIAFILRLLHV
ncbi:hypothetical protein V7156_00490, partial [Priestia megaterium]|uniref:hypothetical protein n=2 Tax=Priestia megaterium TaxID=1404 RepID=UPI00300B911A